MPIRAKRNQPGKRILWVWAVLAVPPLLLVCAFVWGFFRVVEVALGGHTLLWGYDPHTKIVGRTPQILGSMELGWPVGHVAWNIPGDGNGAYTVGWALVRRRIVGTIPDGVVVPVKVTTVDPERKRRMLRSMPRMPFIAPR